MASIENSEGGMPRQSGVSELIVKSAIVLVTAAFFVGAYLQFQLSFWMALCGALSVYITLLLVHALMRRRERETDLVSEVVRLEDEVARLKVGPAPAAAAPAARKERAPTLAPRPGMKLPPAPPPSLGAAPPPLGAAPLAPPPMPAAAPPPLAARPRFAAPAAGLAGEREPRLAAHRPGAPASPGPAPGPVLPNLGMPGLVNPSLDTPTLGAPSRGLPGGEPQRPEPTLSVPPPMPAAMPAAEPTLRADTPLAPGLSAPSLPDWSAPAPAPMAAPSHQARDYWPSRQSKPSLPEAPRAEPPRTESLRVDLPLPAERETDLDAVHGMIKRLADEVSVAGEPALDAPLQQESTLRASLSALQATANAMRTTKKTGGLPASSPPPRPGAPVPPPIMPSHARLAAFAEAIAAGRIDVTLSPIVGLADHQVHYFEVVASPRDERGMVLSAPTRDPQLALAGLLPLVDTARLRQASRVAQSMAEEGRPTQLFAPATAVSLANDGFLDELADAYRDREALAGELVLSFAQADIRTFGGSEWSALTDMRDLGFRFGVEDVSDFDYEFTALCAAGFVFVKLDAATLLAGLAAPGGAMPAAEVCRNLSELGLTLIACNVDDEETRDRILEAGVPLGQGALFGGVPAAASDGFAAAGTAAA